MSIKRSKHTDEILMFLWRWKVASTAALSARFFPDLQPHSAYKRILRLAKNELIAATCDGIGENFLWSLSRKGFEVVKSRLPKLREVGYRSEYPEHDHLVTAVHLGDDLLRPTPAFETWSEQELRRYEIESYPNWVPVSLLHRPDGYWRLRGGREYQAIALEVELSSKKESDYHGIAKFYARHAHVVRVIWLCPTEAMARRLNNFIQESQGVSQNQHSFFLVPDFEKHGWAAVCQVGAEVGVTMRQMLLKASGKPVGNEWDRFPAELFCDLRKRRTKFVEYSTWRKNQKALLTPSSTPNNVTYLN